VVEGGDDGVHPVAQAELVQDPSDVRLHGRLAEVQPPGDLRVRRATAERQQDGALPLGRPGRPAGRLRRGFDGRGTGEPGEQPPGDGRPEQRVAGGERADADDEDLRRAPLEQEPGRAGA
jgi:hypothetical protein